MAESGTQSLFPLQLLHEFPTELFNSQELINPLPMNVECKQ